MSLSYKDIIRSKIILGSMKKEKVILAIDGATKTGWAIYKNGIIVKHGTKQFASATRIKQYGRWLCDIVGENGITHIVAEDIYRLHNRTQDKAFLALAKMQGVLEYVASSANVELSLINPLQVKFMMIPSVTRHERKDDKQRMISRVKFLGYELENDKADDEADAIGILLTYLYNKGIPVTHPNGKRQ